MPAPESAPSGAINISGSIGSVRDIIGRDKITLHFNINGLPLSEYQNLTIEDLNTLKLLFGSLRNANTDTQRSLEELHGLLIRNIVNIDDSYAETNKVCQEITRFVWNEWQQSGMPNETAFIGGHATGETLSEALRKLAEDDERKAYANFLHGCLIIIINALDYDRALDQFALACRIDPREPRYFHTAGDVSMRACRYPDAEMYFRYEIRLITQTSLYRSSSLWRAYNSLGGALDQQYRYHEAIICFEKAAELLMEYNEPEECLGLVFNNLGGALAALQSFFEAEKVYARADNFLKASKIPHHRLRGLVMNNKAEVERQLNRYGEAQNILHYTLHYLRSAYSTTFPKHPVIAKTYNNLGALQLIELHLTKEAKRNLEEAVRLYDDNNIPDFFTSKIITLKNLAQACSELGELHEADSYYNRALSGAGVSLGNNNRLTCAIREDYEIFRKARAMSSTASSIQRPTSR